MEYICRYPTIGLTPNHPVVRPSQPASKPLSPKLPVANAQPALEGLKPR